MKKILMLITCLSYGDDKGGFDFISWSKWVEKRNKPPKKNKGGRPVLYHNYLAYCNINNI